MTPRGIVRDAGPGPCAGLPVSGDGVVLRRRR